MNDLMASENPQHVPPRRTHHISEFKEVLNTICPAVEVIQVSPRGVELRYFQKLYFPMEMMPTESRGTEVMRTLAEEFRVAAFRGLGVDAIIEGYKRDQQRAFQRAQELQIQLNAAHQRIGAMQVELDVLRPKDEEYGDDGHEGLIPR